MNIASQLHHMLYIASMHDYRITKFEMSRDMIWQLRAEEQNSHKLTCEYCGISGVGNFKFCGVPVIQSDIDHIRVETDERNIMRPIDGTAPRPKEKTGRRRLGNNTRQTSNKWR